MKCLVYIILISLYIITSCDLPPDYVDDPLSDENLNSPYFEINDENFLKALIHANVDRNFDKKISNKEAEAITGLNIGGFTYPGDVGYLMDFDEDWGEYVDTRSGESLRLDDALPTNYS